MRTLIFPTVVFGLLVAGAAHGQALDQLEANLFDQAKPGSQEIFVGFVGDDVEGREPAGVEVIDVVEGSPADLAGLRKGDIVFTFNGKRVKSSAELGAALKGVKPGDQTRVSFVRAQRQINTVLTVGSRPAPPQENSVLLPEPSELGPEQGVEVIPAPNPPEIAPAPEMEAEQPQRPVRNLIQGFLGGNGPAEVDAEEVGDLVQGLLGGKTRVRVRVGQTEEGQPEAAPTPAPAGRVRVRVGNPQTGEVLPGEIPPGQIAPNPLPPSPVVNPAVDGQAKSPLAREVQLLREEVLRLRARVQALESKLPQ